MSFESNDPFDAIIQGMDVNPEVVAMDLRHIVISEVNRKFIEFSAINSFALNELAREQILRYNMPEITFPTARALLKPPTARETDKSLGIPELFVYLPYNKEDVRRADETYDIAFFRFISPRGGSAMVAITPTQTVPFAEGEELILEQAEEGTVIKGFRIDCETVDTDIEPINPADEVTLLESIRGCLQKYKPTSQDEGEHDSNGGNRSAA